MAIKDEISNTEEEIWKQKNWKGERERKGSKREEVFSCISTLNN